MEERRDLTKQADFYRWLQEKQDNRAESPQQYIQLEIPEAPIYKNPADETAERGIYIIDLG